MKSRIYFAVKRRGCNLFLRKDGSISGFCLETFLTEDRAEAERKAHSVELVAQEVEVHFPLGARRAGKGQATIERLRGRQTALESTVAACA